MASKSIGTIFASLSLKDENFKKGMNNAQKEVGKFGKIATAAAGVTVAAFAIMGVAALSVGNHLARGTKEIIKMGGELSDLSSQTGIAVASLMQIQQAYKDNGKEAGSAGKDINKMQKAIFDASKDMGGEKDPFGAIGLSVEKLVAMNPSEQFFAIGGAIRSIQDPTRQAAAAMKIFGKSGGELLSVFSGSDIDDINKSLGKMPALMDQMSDKFDRADDLIGRLPNKSNQFFTGFAAGIIDQVLPALEMVDAYDFTDIGLKIGDAIGENVRIGLYWLTSGKAWDIFALHAEKAFFSIASLPIMKQFINMMNTASRIGEIKSLADLEKIASANDNLLSGGLQKNLDQKIENIFRDAALDTYKKPSVTVPSKPMFDPNVIEDAEIEIESKSEPANITNVQNRQFDDYQRRGLSMSKNPGAVQDKIVKVQEQIRDILKAAKIEGKQLVWT